MVVSIACAGEQTVSQAFLILAAQELGIMSMFDPFENMDVTAYNVVVETILDDSISLSALDMNLNEVPFCFMMKFEIFRY